MLVFLLSPGFPAMAFVHALPNIPRMAVSNLLPAKRGGLYARATMAPPLRARRPYE
jgi:hypothetical protein